MTRRIRAGAMRCLCAAGLALAGCGEDDFENEPRPPVPKQLTGVITEEKVDGLARRARRRPRRDHRLEPDRGVAHGHARELRRRHDPRAGRARSTRSTPPRSSARSSRAPTRSARARRRAVPEGDPAGDARRSARNGSPARTSSSCRSRNSWPSRALPASWPYALTALALLAFVAVPAAPAAAEQTARAEAVPQAAAERPRRVDGGQARPAQRRLRRPRHPLRRPDRRRQVRRARAGQRGRLGRPDRAVRLQLARPRSNDGGGGDELRIRYKRQNLYRARASLKRLSRSARRARSSTGRPVYDPGDELSDPGATRVVEVRWRRGATASACEDGAPSTASGRASARRPATTAPRRSSRSAASSTSSCARSASTAATRSA